MNKNYFKGIKKKDRVYDLFENKIMVVKEIQDEISIFKNDLYILIENQH